VEPDTDDPQVTSEIVLLNVVGMHQSIFTKAPKAEVEITETLKLP
jgi:hypothetical protein